MKVGAELARVHGHDPSVVDRQNVATIIAARPGRARRCRWFWPRSEVGPSGSHDGCERSAGPRSRSTNRHSHSSWPGHWATWRGTNDSCSRRKLRQVHDIPPRTATGRVPRATRLPRQGGLSVLPDTAVRGEPGSGGNETHETGCEYASRYPPPCHMSRDTRVGLAFPASAAHGDGLDR